MSAAVEKTASPGPMVTPPAEEPKPAPFSWLDPHPIFVIVLVGPDEQPFGIQKDFLCARSSFYREYFAKRDEDVIEHIVKLPDTPIDVFACTQHFLYTGHVFPDVQHIPSYDVLTGVWKLGNDLGIDRLCDAVLAAMAECRRMTQLIPATPLLVEVWKITPEGSSIRKLLLGWAAEFMRHSDARAEFARSLPQEVLSELVVSMSSLESKPDVSAQPVRKDTAQPPQPRGTVHHLEPDESTEADGAPAKKLRMSSEVLASEQPSHQFSVHQRKALARSSIGPPAKPGPKRRSVGASPTDEYTAEQKLEFCADLLNRMVSGPGFWTRLVGPFKEPVNPVQDGVLDYFEKITHPMDLGTMKKKLDRKEYADERQFLADMNLIFKNCYTYWTKKDPMWIACEKLQKTFEEKYSRMHKWLSKMDGDEGGLAFA